MIHLHAAAAAAAEPVTVPVAVSATNTNMFVKDVAHNYRQQHVAEQSVSQLNNSMLFYSSYENSVVVLRLEDQFFLCNLLLYFDAHIQSVGVFKIALPTTFKLFQKFRKTNQFFAKILKTMNFLKKCSKKKNGN